MIDDERLLQLLKHGRGLEIREYLKTEQKQDYSMDFAIFMDQMLKEHKVSRKTVAIRSGLSQDYTYKLLRGDKKTTERDYILAMCIAIGMNYAQTQHALSIQGMPLLNRTDLRSHVISLAIEKHMGIDKTNEWLEQSGFHFLRTSPDMPSSPVISAPDTAVTGGTLPAQLEYNEVSRNVEAIPCGCAPFDYAYRASLGLENDSGRRFYVTAEYTPAGDFLAVLDEEKFHRWENDDTCADEIEELEFYESIEDTRSSGFFRYFLMLDHETDVKVRETMEAVNDSRDYGSRYGYKSRGEVSYMYTEVFNRTAPEKREYLQIVERSDGETVFSASHESYYMRLELEELYPLIFGKNSPEEYYVKVFSLDDLPEKYAYMRFIFRDIQIGMHEYFQREGVSELDQAQMDDEKIEVLAQRSAAMSRTENWEESYNLLMEMLPIVLKQEKEGKDSTVTLAVTYSKLATLSYNMNRPAEEKQWNEKIYRMKDRILAHMDDDNAESAVFALAEVEMEMARECQAQGEKQEAIRLMNDAISQMEGRCGHITEWITLFQCLGNYAFLLDEDEPEKSLDYYHKALDLARDQLLEQIPSCQMAIVTLYNNLAWVLWNRLGRDEAIMYYLRGIDILEGYQARGQQNPETIATDMLHLSEKLVDIYRKNGRMAEAERLERRVKEWLKEAGIENDNA